jgi:hypothetical protein
MTIELEDLGNGSGKPARFTGKYRGARRENHVRDELGGGADLGGASETVGTAEPPGLELVGGPATGPSPLDFDAMGQPAYPSAAPEWSMASGESLVEHPLLRGLLLELPPRGTAPQTEWLDRWFEAARSILELLYVRETVRPR